ncbi:MAG: chaperone NapD [Rhodospirillaceae bacterium]|jgi:periplasmic nitrate reductase NapD|nr:chaperone NapD [Rhodospirillaceae bacterium]
MKAQGNVAQNPSRRDLVTARFSKSEQIQPGGHVASLMVQARPLHMASLAPVLATIPGVEVHGSNDQGRMIVTVEADNDGHFMEIMARIEGTENVVMASLVYHQIED